MLECDNIDKESKMTYTDIINKKAEVRNVY